MKKRIVVMILTFAMLFAVSVSASAEDVSIGYESAYDADKGIVSVSVFVDNAIGLQAVDLSLAFDEGMYTFDNYDEADITDGMIIASYIERTPGLATCSVIFTEECVESDVDENGRLNLVTFTFKPVDENYDINEFYLWTTCLQVGDVDIFEEIEGQGNESLQEDKTDTVTKPPSNDSGNKDSTTKKGTAGINGNLSSKWYVYVIAGVLAIGAIAGIAMVAIKSGHNEEEDASDKEEESENSEK